MKIDIKKIILIIRGFIRKLSPPLLVGGLQITDSAVRYFQFKSSGNLSASLRLQPGIIENGKIKNKAALVATLQELRSRISPDSKDIISAIVTLPISDVYIQTFGVPRVAEGNFKEAAELNAKMISPVDIEKSYFSWQRVLDSGGVRSDISLLGAFILKEVADELIVSIEEAGFGIAAVEFSSMSIVRDIERRNILAKGSPYVVAEVTAEGIKFVAVRKGLPHFHYLHHWADVQGNDKAISIDKLKSAFEAELVSILNFYSTQWGGEVLGDLVVVTPAFSEDILSFISGRFKELSVKVIKPYEASPTIGAALRGAIPRAEDSDISLSSLSALEVFESKQSKNFLRIWRNIFLVVLGFILVVFISSNILVRKELGRVSEEARMALADPRIEEFNSLASDSQEFNNLVLRMLDIRSRGDKISPLLLEIDSIMGDDIAITRLNFQSLSLPVLLNGSASSRDSVVALKNRLVSHEEFSNVSLPLSNISGSGDSITFTITFNVNSLDFGELDLGSTDDINEDADIDEDVDEDVDANEDKNTLITEEAKTESSLGTELQGAAEQLEEAKPEASEPLIIFGNLTFISATEPVTLEASALDSDAANLFRNLLEATSVFSDVTIISQSAGTDGRLQITLRFFVSI